MGKVRLNRRGISREIFFMIPRVVSQHCTALGPERAYLSQEIYTSLALLQSPLGCCRKELFQHRYYEDDRPHSSIDMLFIASCVRMVSNQMFCSLIGFNYHFLHLSDFNVVS